jgi:16S rRNA (cytidine1402-2'-O)-methyltransferase
MKNPVLYLIPVTLGDTPVEKVIPSFNTTVASDLKYFIVENVRSARRFLKKSNPDIDIDTLTFYELNKHTDPNQIASYLSP